MKRRISPIASRGWWPAKQDVGDDDGAGIDERVARNAVLVLELDDRVERIAGRLAPDPLPQRVADLAERQRQREHLRDALDRERLVGVARRQHAAVVGDDGDAELLRIDLAQLRNVGRDLAAIGRARPFRRRAPASTSSRSAMSAMPLLQPAFDARHRLDHVVMAAGIGKPHRSDAPAAVSKSRPGVAATCASASMLRAKSMLSLVWRETSQKA